jgi:cell division protein FtsB
MKKWIILSVVLLLMLQFTLWTGQGSLADFFNLQKNLQTQVQENQTLIERNAALTGDVIDLKEGFEAIEERARNEMGMIKEGETFYQVVQDEQG